MGVYRNNIEPFLINGVPEEALAYRQRVEADGGAVTDWGRVVQMFRLLKREGLLSGLLHLSSALAGVKADAQGRVLRLYSLDPSHNDALRDTEAKSPVFQNDTLVYDGVDDRLRLTALVVINGTNGTIMARALPNYGKDNAIVGSFASTRPFFRIPSSTELRSRDNGTETSSSFAFPSFAGGEVRAALVRSAGFDRAYANGQESTTGARPNTGGMAIDQLGQQFTAETAAYRGVLMQGQMGSVGLYNPALSVAQLQEIEAIGL